MGVKFSRLLAGHEKEAEVCYEGETFGVVYIPERLTPELQSKIKELQKKDPESFDLIAYMCEYIVGWKGVLEEDGGEMPFEPERLAKLGFSVLSAIVEAVGNEMSVGKSKKTRSTPG